MFELFNNGKVIVTHNQVTIKGMMSSRTYNRVEIKDTTYFTGFSRILGIITNIILFWGIVRAIKMMTNIRVHINLYNGKHHSFYITSAEYKQLRNVL